MLPTLSPWIKILKTSVNGRFIRNECCPRECDIGQVCSDGRRGKGKVEEGVLNMGCSSQKAVEFEDSRLPENSGYQVKKPSQAGALFFLGCNF